VERWLLARLRHHTFFSLAEVNAALQPLPTHPYEYAEWKHARVNIDYHVEVGTGSV
jgi:hypothetical protein